MKFKRPGYKTDFRIPVKLEDKAGKLQEKEQELEQMTKNIEP